MVNPVRLETAFSCTLSRRRFAATGAAAALILMLLTDAQAAEPPLFDGKTLEGWTTPDGKPVAKGWEVVDGTIHLDRKKGAAGNIVTAHEYGDFDLTFEWKIAPGGNNGLKYRVRRFDGGWRGCEYQIFDDAKNKNRVTPKYSAGALYDLYEPNEDKRLNPPGEFNQARIVSRGTTLEHWLNGKLIVSATVGSPEWNERIAKSKFADLKDFGRESRGKIMLTDHGSEVWYRNFEFHQVDQ